MVDKDTPQPGIGDRLGLPDGRFAVRRNIYDADGNRVQGEFTMDDGGWRVFRTREHEGSTRVDLINEAGDSKLGMSLDTVLSWQHPADDVLPPPAAGGAIAVAGLIDEVPRTPEDFAAFEDQREAARHAAVDEELARLDVEMEELMEGLSEQDSAALWKYASGVINKQEAQQRCDGQESMNQGMISGEGYREMSDRARGMKERYLGVMRQRNHLLRSR